MKKIFFLALATACLGIFTNNASAQSKSFYATPYKERNSGSFSKGTSLLSLGYGIGSINHLGIWTGYSSIPIGPIYLKYEVGVMDELSIGGYIAPEYTIRRLNGNAYSNSLGLGLGVLGYYHFNKFIPVEKLDVYAGAGFGIKYYGETYKNNTIKNYSKIYPRPLVKVGARYYLANNFAVYLESGYDNSSSLNIGITLRF